MGLEELREQHLLDEAPPWQALFRDRLDLTERKCTALHEKLVLSVDDLQKQMQCMMQAIEKVIPVSVSLGVAAAMAPEAPNSHLKDLATRLSRVEELLQVEKSKAIPEAVEPFRSDEPYRAVGQAEPHIATLQSEMNTKLDKEDLINFKNEIDKKLDTKVDIVAWKESYDDVESEIFGRLNELEVETGLSMSSDRFSRDTLYDRVHSLWVKADSSSTVPPAKASAAAASSSAAPATTASATSSDKEGCVLPKRRLL